MAFAGILALCIGAYTSFRLAYPKAERVSDLTLANLEALAWPWEDLDKDPWPPIPDGENRNKWLNWKNPITGKWETGCSGSGNDCRAGVD